ncbi:phosphoglycerate mutase Ecym_6251 [Eremothecium cymbalariae DBVPG|uniref:Uncharacterized protein n=1 Tax=Eremothecium cymbalariae (strain CBS 270.75 / DBVPG 7215 / KCTC 17166 / NRRL Y-17582) TaxID=931890 RepID=G8JVF4_ERECY|nr:hypothetical protein Ecym_6251 [Eremothecium cymbalariae DBVPG\
MGKPIQFYCNNDKQNVLRIFVIRHGQTAENMNKVLQGHKDTSLNETGYEQADKLGSYLVNEQDIKFDKVICSDLKRCQQTIKQILGHYDEHNRPEVELTYRLRERFLGPIEGMVLENAEKYATANGKGSFKDFGEQLDKFETRIVSKVKEVVGECQNMKNIALITHGGSIRQLLKSLNYNDIPIHKVTVFNTSVTIIDYIKDSSTFEVRRVGNTQHLGDGLFIVNDSRLR